jgi:hypothetical protein
MDDSINILNSIREAKVIVYSQSLKVYEKEFFIPDIINLYDYPFESKFIECKCYVCSEKVKIGIYENGGHLRGEGASNNIITGWGYSYKNKLNYSKALALSKALNILFEQLNDEDYALIINSNYKHCFALFKKCNSCNSEYILIFEPTGELYREIALQFYIHSVLYVETSKEFKQKYIETEN